LDPAVAAQPDATPPDERVDRLTRDLADALEQQSATSQVLETIGRSAFELRPVFETVVRHAIRLCAADGGYVHQLGGDVYRLEVALGGRPEHRRYLEQHPIPQGPGTLVGRVALEKRTVQISDAAADPKYEWHRAQQLGGFRTLLGVPMLAEGRVVGVIALWRSRVEPFDDREIRLVTTFAAQGLIAIQNVRLFREHEQRSRELARSVDELRALGEVSQAVSLSLDLDEVLNTIVTRAVELSGADGGSIFEYEPSTAEFVLRTCFGTSAELAEALASIRIRVGETFIGRAAIAGEAAQAEDLDREPPDLHIEELRRHGWRSLVTVPLRREQEIIGALTVRSKVPGALPKPTVALLETLASQSTVAINNARVFRELEDKTSQLEVASRHKSEFLASMSHELRIPLNERQEEYVGDIRDSGRHLLELINEILDLSKVEAGRMELELAAVSLPDLLAQGVAMVRERADRHGISVSLEVAADLGSILGDELKLRQVVLNLLSNAVKFTPDRGSVVVTAELVDGNAKVSVRDTGIGIAESERERIFEAFQRGGREARSNTEGTGLGLTLSRQIIELHGGRLWMESELGVGSTFTFAIPVGIPSPLGADLPLKATTPVPDGRSSAGGVLVVEDDRRSADLMRVYLDGAGYTVSITGDGLEALELVRRLRPRAVILDILLPGLSGWDLLTRLKADPATAAIPVVIASMLDERGAGFALGASEYLVKPIDREALLEALGRCVAPPKSMRTVVVIDDDPLDLELVEAVLAPVGWSVLRASGGEEGVELVRCERPSVVLLDLLMPDVNGFEVIERLRADPSVADVPIVVLTSKEITPADHERLAGRISFLAQKGTFKPAELVDLVGRVASAPTIPSNEPP
jgi:signal transduction histidine kinase/CheY-like chemotaxis protein